ncbi:PLD nuclease N-terminal domain-containing protein [Streptomyces sp. XM4193]|uniref:PLD nuclease N-terminal domain-containing protein n=1 Tax=Streptomyces sp. XM4193 TaxID=2929782 RepID=UPI001FF8E372|nr:PLD nuclease N-terminal domain-containing protein [Streptomyces sp. XM4193]MCK1796605.1 PLD nuclease N-terminal domain-containing protein [Streptomyces sp. XM4193]
MIKYLPFLLVLAVWIYAFIDCLNTPEKEVRKLPKVMWVIIVLLFGQVLIGPIAWFAVGRPRKTAYGSTKANERRWVAPDDNPDFLKSLREDDGSGSGGGRPRKPDAEESLDRWEEEFRRNRKGKGDTGGPEDTPPPPAKS